METLGGEGALIPVASEASDKKSLVQQNAREKALVILDEAKQENLALIREEENKKLEGVINEKNWEFADVYIAACHKVLSLTQKQLQGYDPDVLAEFGHIIAERTRPFAIAQKIFCPYDNLAIWSFGGPLLVGATVFGPVGMLLGLLTSVASTSLLNATNVIDGNLNLRSNVVSKRYWELYSFLLKHGGNKYLPYEVIKKRLAGQGRYEDFD